MSKIKKSRKDNFCKKVCISEGGPKFLDEKLSSGAFELTFRKMIYIMVGGLMSYKLIESYKAPDILLGTSLNPAIKVPRVNMPRISSTS